MNSDIATERIDYDDGGHAEIQKLNGKNHGWWTVFNADGSKRWERHYQNGKQHGPDRAWFPGGAIDREWTFVGGKLHGPWKTWYQNGQIKNESFFTEGKEDLFDRWYDPNGKLVAEQRIFGGVKDGTAVCSQFDEETGEETTGIIEFRHGKSVRFTPFPDSIDYFGNDR